MFPATQTYVNPLLLVDSSDFTFFDPDSTQYMDGVPQFTDSDIEHLFLQYFDELNDGSHGSTPSAHLDMDHFTPLRPISSGSPGLRSIHTVVNPFPNSSRPHGVIAKNVSSAGIVAANDLAVQTTRSSVTNIATGGQSDLHANHIRQAQDYQYAFSHHSLSHPVPHSNFWGNSSTVSKRGNYEMTEQTSSNTVNIQQPIKRLSLPKKKDF